MKIQTIAWHCFNSWSTLLLFFCLGSFQWAHVAACVFCIGRYAGCKSGPKPGKTHSRCVSLWKKLQNVALVAGFNLHSFSSSKTQQREFYGHISGAHLFKKIAIFESTMKRTSAVHQSSTCFHSKYSYWVCFLRLWIIYKGTKSLCLGPLKHGAFATKIASIYPQLCGLRCHTQFVIVTFQRTTHISLI